MVDSKFYLDIEIIQTLIASKSCVGWNGYCATDWNI